MPTVVLAISNRHLIYHGSREIFIALEWKWLADDSLSIRIDSMAGVTRNTGCASSLCDMFVNKVHALGSAWKSAKYSARSSCAHYTITRWHSNEQRFGVSLISYPITIFFLNTVAPIPSEFFPRHSVIASNPSWSDRCSAKNANDKVTAGVSELRQQGPGSAYLFRAYRPNEIQKTRVATFLRIRMYVHTGCSIQLKGKIKVIPKIVLR